MTTSYDLRPGPLIDMNTSGLVAFRMVVGGNHDSLIARKVFVKIVFLRIVKYLRNIAEEIKSIQNKCNLS